MSIFWLVAAEKIHHQCGSAAKIQQSAVFARRNQLKHHLIAGLRIRLIGPIHPLVAIPELFKTILVV